MLLSIDWDAFSGTRELVFDAPIWGSRDREQDRLAAWTERARRRGARQGSGDWEVLAGDFPLYAGWEELRRYRGVPGFMALSHADAWAWLERFPGQDVVNVDSHCDLVSLSGDGQRIRPGNWAGLALERGLIRSYHCLYPWWHQTLPVAEGYDLERTSQELAAQWSPALLARVTLTRQPNPASGWPPAQQVDSVLLVQSPAWTSPAHDEHFWALAEGLDAAVLTLPLRRGRREGHKNSPTAWQGEGDSRKGE